MGFLKSSLPCRRHLPLLPCRLAALVVCILKLRLKHGHRHRGFSIIFWGSEQFRRYIFFVGETMARRLRADFVSDSGGPPVPLTQLLMVRLCSWLCPDEITSSLLQRALLRSPASCRARQS